MFLYFYRFTDHFQRFHVSNLQYCYAGSVLLKAPTFGEQAVIISQR